ncbi:MAG: YicC family protein [bacterium]|nr:YicC family protein [bacterium]
MIRSMTGFGSARKEANGLKIQADLRSVNNRFFDCQCRMSREIQFLEGEISERARKLLSRGRLNVQITLESEPGATIPRLDPGVLQAYRESLDLVQRECALEKRGSATEFLSLPDLFGGEEPGPGRDELRTMTMEAVEEALAALIAMREREGEALVAELNQRLVILTDALARVEALVPEARETLRTNLNTRVEELLDGVAVDPQRLAQELALLVDRCDITEETVRLHSHLDQFGEVLTVGGEVSKKLGFILQEILRETNTIGSKAQALTIIKEVLLIKEEVEKLREQILNLE